MSHSWYSAAAVGTDHHPALVILQCDKPVLLEYRSVGGLRVADIRVDAVRIERGRNRTGGDQLMRQERILKLRAQQPHHRARPSLKASSSCAPRCTASVIFR